MSQKQFNIVVLISGNGSNLQAIIDAIEQQKLAINILAVISNHEDAYGLQRAKLANIATHCIPHEDFPSREAFDSALQKLIDDYQPDLICLAGFMRRLGADFVNHYANKIINIHPALLPKYPGLNTHQKALDARDKFHGATIHIVTEALDAGPIIAQKRLRILPDDTAESLKSRVQQLEHQLYPETLKNLSK